MSLFMLVSTKGLSEASLDAREADLSRTVDLSSTLELEKRRSHDSPCERRGVKMLLTFQDDLRARAARRLRERRSSSLMPPQTPASWPFSSAHFRQVSTTSQRPHTSFALAIWAMAGPVFPTGKKSSGSTVRHAAWLRQSIRAPFKVIGHAAITCPACQGSATTSENNFHMAGGGGQDLDRETCDDSLS